MTDKVLPPGFVSSWKPKSKTKADPLPYGAAGLIYVFGYHNNQLAHRFQAICGEQPPTITGGWPNVTNVTRPRSLDYTMVTDYPGLTMDVSLRFDCWLTPFTNPNLEGDLQKLTWMWGRGKLGPGTPHSGNPPVIKFAAYNNTKTQIPLIPPDCQDLEWIITNVQYDASPLRLNAGQIKARGLNVPVGTRGRQDLIISVMQWEPPPGFKTQKAKAPNGIHYYYSTSKADSIRAMCQIYFDRHKQSDYKKVINLAANKHLHIRNPGQKLKPHTNVAFPANFKDSGR